MGLPNIIINFKEQATTAKKRSERGVVALVVKDGTSPAGTKMYRSFDEVQSKEYTKDNYAVIKDTFIDSPVQVYVIKIGMEQAFTDAKAELDKLRVNWICFIDATQTGVAEYVKARNAKNPATLVKAVVFQDNSADDMHVVNFANDTVTRKGEAEAIEGYKYLGRIAGMLAALPMTRTSTNYILEDLDAVAEVADASADIDAGKFVLINDYGSIRVGRGVNTLKTGKDSLKKIAIVETMDQMHDDITKTFKDGYCGQFKNNLDNQKIFISAINTYLMALAEEEVLDKNYLNVALIDTDKQRQKWIEAGHEEARAWDDKEVEKRTFSSYIYLKGNVKILDGIEDLEFDITMSN